MRESLFRIAGKLDDNGFPELASTLRKIAEKSPSEDVDAIVRILRD